MKTDGNQLKKQVIDRWGRRNLWLFGSVGLCLLYICIGMFYYMELKGFALVVLVVMAIAVYAMTLAPVFWVLVSEIFPNRIRGDVLNNQCTMVGQLFIDLQFPDFK